MPSELPVLVILDLLGAFAFALNGALTAVRAAALDIVGVVTLGLITAVGGGILRDVMLGSLPPATFADWRYLIVAAAGGLLAFLFSRRLAKLALPITVLDAAGLSLFAVTGAGRALELGAGPAQAVILGAVTAVGGGTIRDVLIGRIPGVLTGGLYAVPALVGATLFVVLSDTPAAAALGASLAVGPAVICFVIRMLGVRFDLDAPRPPGTRSIRENDAP